MTADPAEVELSVEPEPSADDVHRLAEGLYAANVETTGIADGRDIAVFLRRADRTVIGGAEGWTWGGTCYVRHLVVPAPLRRKGYGTRLMQALEREARARGCTEILLDTYDFQAPGFYRRLGFTPVAEVDGYVRDFRYIILRKRL